MPFLCRKYRNCTGDPSVYFHNSSYDETICEKEGEKMLIILGLILMIVIVLVGGDRGAMSLIALAGNILCLSLAIWLYAVGAPVFLVTAGAGILISCITLFYQNGTNIKT